jgi:UDP:flavonoid glycosyltransferase YjiC (YdhE family)
VLADYNLPPVVKVEELHVGDLTLVAGIPETDPLPKGVKATYIGPILWQKPDASLPDWIDTLDEEKPVIWVYTGNPRYFEPFVTWGDSMVVLEACTAALAKESVQVILTTGYHNLPTGSSSLPANFHYEPYLPGLAMGERSDLIVHHGGHGASLTGPYTGTPAVIIPTFSERESNARRIAAQGAAAFIVPTEDESSEKHISAEQLLAKIKTVLSESSFTENAERMSEKLHAYGGASEAASLIEDFIAQS